MIITISGLPGMDVRAIGKLLALQLGMRYIDANELLASGMSRNIRQENGETLLETNYVAKAKALLKESAARGDAIIESGSSAWLLPEADVKIFLNSMKKNRAVRLCQKHGMPLGEALQKISDDESNEANALLRNFGFDLYDWSNYDLVLNADRLDIDSIAAMVRKFLERVSK